MNQQRTTKQKGVRTTASTHISLKSSPAQKKMKASHVCLVFLANCCLSTLALPALVKEDSKDYDFRENAQESKRGVSFATGLGHTNTNNDNNKEREKIFAELFGKRDMTDLKREYSDYLNEWKNMYNALYPDNPQQKRAPSFTFGTALGHNQGRDNGKYVDSLKNKFNELFGDQ